VVSYKSLEKSLEFKEALPVTENWSAAPDFLKIISDFCLKHKPKTIVECSSGTSSLVLSQCCKLNNYGHVYSLENGEEFASKTRNHLGEHLLEEYCDVIFSPLKEYEVNGERYQWYDLKEFTDTEIDMLVVDGPPGFMQKNSRYPALPLLRELIAPGCVIFLDDAAREDEKDLVELWLNECPEFNSQYVDNERGCVILTR
jgi:predicted O-methyltransferase YrrM